MNTLIDITAYPVRNVLKTLLVDKTTKQNIVFATDSYSYLGDRFLPNRRLDFNTILGMDSCLIQPRVFKNKQEQYDRTKNKAEVMTPSWVVNKMNNQCDENWFGYANVFNSETGNSWEVNMNPIYFPENKKWQDYVDSMHLEITCGEAPYLVSRYDTTTGNIIPVEDRIGVLDRKLRVVGENTNTKEEWLKWTIRAFQSAYGFEYQGDNLLIGRINLLITFVDYMDKKWGERPTDDVLNKIATIISWNLWQMDGLTGYIPYAFNKSNAYQQLSLFDIIDGDVESKTEEVPIPATIFDWRKNKAVRYNGLKEN